MHKIEVLPVGTKVCIFDNIKAIINGIFIGRNHYILYKVIWWDGRSRKEEYITPQEINSLNIPTIPIGFLNPSDIPVEF